ncbi:unnamed protein product [Lupinus luteus]|uniref:Uncharacterized protein n=1 Tax=Lupinus luteus TaxID=3873 RepID=A0AAV1WKE8_LUPLU
MACVKKKNTLKEKEEPTTLLSQSDIEAANNLIQLSSCNNNNYNMQLKSQHCKDDDATIEDILADIEEDESLKRINKSPCANFINGCIRGIRM